MRRFVLCLNLVLFCSFFISVSFSPFSIAITSHGKERANLNHVCSICACLVFSSSLRLERAAVCNCSTPWTFLFPFL